MPGSFMLQALAYGSAPARRRRAMYAYSPSSRSSGTSRRRNRIRPAAMITRVTPPQAFTASRVDRDPSPRQLLCARSRRCAARFCGARLLPALLQQLCDEPRPAGLVAGPDARTVVAVEVFVEEDQVAPVRVTLKFLGPPVDGTAPVLVAEEDSREAPRDLAGYRPQVEHGPGAGRARHLERIAVEVVELLERLDQEIVHREPDGAPPVRVAPEEPAGGLGWLVVDPVPHPVDPQHGRVVAVAS